MKVTNIYLARHGETDFNRRNLIQGQGIDASLNNTGRNQARAIGYYLKKEVELQRIFSSSLKRSQETARIVADMFGLEIKSYADLDEMNFGILEGRPIHEIKTQLVRLRRHWKSGNIDFALKNGESPQAVLNRASGRIKTIIQEYPKENLLFVLHGRLLRILLSHWLNYGLSKMAQIEHANGALYHLQWDGQYFEPVFLNNTGHLKAEHYETVWGSVP